MQKVFISEDSDMRASLNGEDTACAISIDFLPHKRNNRQFPL